ncbi:MAG: hypothetical protein OEW19_14795 [Acidobacteriota bacterium]|nr:hypothetical protein [Acidobacteriota bacterium]
MIGAARVAVVGAACALSAATASAQTLAVDTTQSVGASSESISAAGMQVRLLGEVATGLRIHLEAAWGARSRDESDVFGTAYPYDGRPQIIETYAEYFFAGGRSLRSIKGGRYRTPFGISAASDHAYIGFLRPPLIRYGEYFALSSGYLEHGVAVVVGVPRFSVEASVGTPGDVGEATRRSGVTGVVRTEAAAGPLIVGASFLDTTPYLPAGFARGRARFGGVDARWMKGGVMLRGEWLDGQPFDGTRTAGGYVDLVVHRPRMGPATAFARAERLGYDAAPPFALASHRYTGGARVRIVGRLAVSIGVVHQAGQLTQRHRTAAEIGLTGSWRKRF